MQELKRLPVGEDNFRKVRQKNCYYVDKTHLIEKLLNSGASVRDTFVRKGTKENFYHGI